MHHGNWFSLDKPRSYFSKTLTLRRGRLLNLGPYSTGMIVLSLILLQVTKQQEEVERRERELEEERMRQLELEKLERLEAERRKLEMEKKKKEKLERQERLLREKILKNMKVVEERKQEKQREDLRKKISGTTRLKSAVIMHKWLGGVLAEQEQMDSD